MIGRWYPNTSHDIRSWCDWSDTEQHSEGNVGFMQGNACRLLPWHGERSHEDTFYTSAISRSRPLAATLVAYQSSNAQRSRNVTSRLHLVGKTRECARGPRKDNRHSVLVLRSKILACRGSVRKKTSELTRSDVSKNSRGARRRTRNPSCWSASAQAREGMGMGIAQCPSCFV